MKLLLIEDDQATADFIVRGLKEHGHITDHANNGLDGLVLAQNEHYDVFILDRMLPKLDGLTLLRTIRNAGNLTPVLMLTAMGSIEDRVTGLTAGAEDYLMKPFAFTELHARVCALARRPPLSQAVISLSIADLEMDLIKRRVTRANQIIELQPTEFKLLEFLLRHAGQVITRAMLLEGVWDFHFDPKTNMVETHISRLRTKVDKNFDFPLIHTVRGSGYRIDAPT
ncbi:response regulator [Zhongshania marina]|uniref:DNA-binding response regulator n=1 Tax=Zhongshania marina TaxID=2304603 RepID=A0A2S4HE46_9GAMM|nr:response regulator transcription factor [Marortus luteolus]POP52266.1 DNA-binding response regulator [Marortus luteolus]